MSIYARGLLRRIGPPRQAEPEFAWCESWTAGPTTPVHVRRLTAVGLKPSGGADTAALCGREVSWDVSATDAEGVARAQQSEAPTARVCASCAVAVKDAEQAP